MGSVSFDLTLGVVISWISVESLRLPHARQSIPADTAYEAQPVTRRELRASWCGDLETWWSQRASEMKHAAAMGNYRKLFHFIRATGKKNIEGETIYKADGSPIHNHQRRLVR